MGNQIELRHLRYFLAVAEELHFRKAADKLYISQPGLSRQIKQMEQDLEIRLFDRNNRKVSLTTAGAYMKNEIALLLRNLENVLTHAKLLQEGSEGNIVMGYVGSAMQNVIPNLLNKFREDHPTIHYSLKEMDNDMQVQGLLNQNIDIGFVRLNQVPANLGIRSVSKETFSLVLPKDHHINDRNFVSLSQLKQESFILFEKDYSPVYYERVMSIFEFTGFTPIISHRTVQANTIFKLVENHFGVSIVPTSLKLGYDLNVNFIELKKIPQRTTLSVVWNTKTRNPIVQKILELI